MVRSLLVRGMLVGAVAGFLAFLFAHHFGEPQVARAIDFEGYLARMHHDPAEAEIVSRGTQRTWGLLTGTMAMGIALGGLFSLAFAWAYGRIGPWGVRTTAAVLAFAAFLTITLIPFTKYPANPPTVGNPDTIGRRTVLYFLMIIISLAAALAAGRIRRSLLPRLGPWNAGIAAAASFLVLIALAEILLPSVHEIPTGFPADVLYRFRLASLGINATLWLTVGLGFGAVAERLLSPASTRTSAPATAPAQP